MQASEARAAVSEETARLARGQLAESQRALAERTAAWSAEKAALQQQHQAHAAVCPPLKSCCKSASNVLVAYGRDDDLQIVLLIWEN